MERHAAPGAATNYETMPAETWPSMEDVRGLYAPAPAAFRTYGGHEHMIIYSAASIIHAARLLICRSDSVFASIAWATLPKLLYELKNTQKVAVVVHAERDLASPRTDAMRRTVGIYQSLPGFTPWRADGTLDPLFAGTAFEHVAPAYSGTVPAVRCAGFSKDWSSPKDDNNRFMHRKIIVGYRAGAPVGVLIGSANMTHTASISLDAACLFFDPRAVHDALVEFTHLYIASGRIDEAPTWHTLSQQDFVALSTAPIQIKKKTVGDRMRSDEALEAEFNRLLTAGGVSAVPPPRGGGAPAVIEPEDAACDEAASASAPTPERWLEECAPATPAAELRWFRGCLPRPLSEIAAAWCSERMACSCFISGRGLGSAQRAVRSAPQIWMRATSASASATTASCTFCVESGEWPCAACGPAAAAHGAHGAARTPEERGAAARASFLAMQALLARLRRLFVRDDGTVARPHFRLEVFAFDGANGEPVTTYAWVQTDDVGARQR